MSSRAMRWAVGTVVIIALIIGIWGKRLGITGRKKDCEKSEWAAGVLTGKDLFDLSDPQGVTNPVIKAADITDRNARFVADTFIIPFQGTWYMFFEVLNRGTEEGDIGYATSTDMLHWRYQSIVLDEPFHLSYPYVFEYNGEHYMIPESRKAQSIRLYKASSFPTGWKLEKVLVEGNYADNSIVQYNGMWWIFAVKGVYNLAILSSPSLFGPWTEHPMTPVYTHDGSKARPGGRVILYKGKLLRFAQDSRGGYGHALRVFIVDELTPTTFSEHEAEKSPILFPSGNGWKSQAMHNMDPWVLPDGSWVAGIDGAGCPKPAAAGTPAAPVQPSSAGSSEGNPSEQDENGA